VSILCVNFFRASSWAINIIVSASQYLNHPISKTKSLTHNVAFVQVAKI
jgi:hypothetical protein